MRPKTSVGVRLRACRLVASASKGAGSADAGDNDEFPAAAPALREMSLREMSLDEVRSCRVRARSGLAGNWFFFSGFFFFGPCEFGLLMGSVNAPVHVEEALTKGGMRWRGAGV
eukprot:840694-Rhodomonas_salina.1